MALLWVSPLLSSALTIAIPLPPKVIVP